MTPCANVTVVIFTHPLNIFVWVAMVTLPLYVSEVNPVHPLNAAEAIVVTVDGMVMDVNPVHPKNVDALIVAIPEGIVIDDKLEHPENA